MAPRKVIDFVELMFRAIAGIFYRTRQKDSRGSGIISEGIIDSITKNVNKVVDKMLVSKT